jgi:uroporphyrinogen decarboxylase
MLTVPSTPDLLNARERMNLLLMDERPDRVPAAPLITSHAAAVSGINVTTYCTDGAAMGKAHVAAYEEYGHDLLCLFTVVAMVAEAMGAELLYRDGHLPVLQRPPVGRDGDLSRLRVPNPQRDGSMPAILEATEYCFSRLAHLVPVGVFVAAPFSTAALLRGVEGFMEDLVDAPQRATDLIALATEATIPFIDAVICEGGLPVLVDPLASCSVISPAMYGRHALPAQQKLISHLHRYDMDVMLHICGRTEGVLHLLPATGAELISIDQVELGAVCAAVGDRMRVVGNVSPTEVMAGGTPDEVEEAVVRCIYTAANAPKGFVASTGCELPYHTPRENVHAFIRGVRAAGAYWPTARRNRFGDGAPAVRVE